MPVLVGRGPAPSCPSSGTCWWLRDGPASASPGDALCSAVVVRAGARGAGLGSGARSRPRVRGCRPLWEGAVLSCPSSGARRWLTGRPESAPPDTLSRAAVGPSRSRAGQARSRRGCGCRPGGGAAPSCPHCGVRRRLPDGAGARDSGHGVQRGGRPNRRAGQGSRAPSCPGEGARCPRLETGAGTKVLRARGVGHPATPARARVPGSVVRSEPAPLCSALRRSDPVRVRRPRTPAVERGPPSWPTRPPSTSVQEDPSTASRTVPSVR